MELKGHQLGSAEQKTILESLARAESRPGCQFLEVGRYPSHQTEERMPGGFLQCKPQLRIGPRESKPKVSIILIDWGVRESFHSIHYLNTQTVPRDQYELIWIEFYDRKPAELLRLVENDQPMLLDKWLVLGYPTSVQYHKHRMYNAGIILAEGEICVICDSDAMFQPSFVESILKAFQNHPEAVIHIDEVRNYSKRFYPFNYPPLAEVLGEGCVNWTGKTTTGLDNHPDMVHAANYGACMAAWREDLIRIGGADEHIDYLGYICGPYELTFRLANFGREEHWLRNEYLYHVWHPNTSGCNVEYKGPDDGRGMSLTALNLRKDAGRRIEPHQENLAIRLLRERSGEHVVQLLQRLVQEDSGSWEINRIIQDEQPELSLKNYFGFNLYTFHGTWYGLPRDEGELDPEKVQNQLYQCCLAAPSRAELLQLIRNYRKNRGRLINYLPDQLLSPRVWDYGKRILRLFRQGLGGPQELPQDEIHPWLFQQGYYGHNIIYYRGTWYGLGQCEGAFDESKLQKQQYHQCVTGYTVQEVKKAIRRQTPLYRRAWLTARKLVRLG